MTPSEAVAYAMRLLRECNPTPDALAEIERVQREMEADQASGLSDEEYGGLPWDGNEPKMRGALNALITARESSATVLLVAALNKLPKRTEIERDALAQAVWDVRASFGFDTGGDHRYHSSDYLEVARQFARDMAEIHAEWEMEK